MAMTKKEQAEMGPGKTYKINHARKGRFTVKTIEIDGEWITVEIVSGVANAMMEYNVAKSGEQITLRISHILSFEEV